MALALDTSVAGTAGSGTSLVLSLPASVANAIIYVIVETNGGPVVSITASGLTFAKRVSANTGNAAFTVEGWYAVAASSFSGNITITTTGSAFIAACAFGIAGADTTTKFDSNGTVPALSNGSGGAQPSISTSNNDDFLISGYRFGSQANPTAGTGWTAISGANFMLAQYKIVAATQSSLLPPIGTGAGNQNGGIADAIIQATAGGGSPTLPQLERNIRGLHRGMIRGNR